MWFFSGRESGARAEADRYNAEVLLSSLELRVPRSLGVAWLGFRLWEDLKLMRFGVNSSPSIATRWESAKVLEWIAVDRLWTPGSQLPLHARWFGQTARDFLLGCEASVAGKDRLDQELETKRWSTRRGYSRIRSAGGSIP